MTGLAGAAPRGRPLLARDTPPRHSERAAPRSKHQDEREMMGNREEMTHE